MRSSIISVLFFVILFICHYGIAVSLPDLYFGPEIILSYAVLIILESIRLILFIAFEKGKLKLEFVQVFMVFTTVQMLASFAYAVFMTMEFRENAEPVLLQFVLMFFITLIYQIFIFRAYGSKLSEQE